MTVIQIDAVKAERFELLIEKLEKRLSDAENKLIALEKPMNDLEVKKYLGIKGKSDSNTQLLRYIKSGLPFSQKGSKRYYSRQAVNKWVFENNLK